MYSLFSYPWNSEYIGNVFVYLFRVLGFERTFEFRTSNLFKKPDRTLNLTKQTATKIVCISSKTQNIPNLRFVIKTRTSQIPQKRPNLATYRGKIRSTKHWFCITYLSTLAPMLTYPTFALGLSQSFPTSTRREKSNNWKQSPHRPTASG